MPGPEDFGYRHELRRTLTVPDLVIYGMVFMVPISPFGVFGFVSQDAKGMVPLAYLVGLVGMFFTAMSYASMSREFPVAGSVYSYVGRGLHEVAGFFADWLIPLDCILVPALLYIFSIVALQPLFPAVPQLVWLLAFVGFNAAANLMGVHLTARVNFGMLAVIMLRMLLALPLFLGLSWSTRRSCWPSARSSLESPSRADSGFGSRSATPACWSSLRTTSWCTSRFVPRDAPYTSFSCQASGELPA